LSVPPAETYWQVHVPEEYEVSWTEGTVKSVVAGVRIGGRLKANVADAQRLVEILEKAPNEQLRNRALINLNRVQQELSDNTTQLEESQRVDLIQDTQRIQGRDLKAQKDDNWKVQSTANLWREKIQVHEEDMRKALAEEAGPKQRQAVKDSLSFFANQWRGGKRFRGAEGPGDKGQGGVALSSLRQKAPFGGLEGVTLKVAEAPVFQVEERPIPPGGGLKAEEAWSVGGGLSMAEIGIPEAGTLYTYRSLNLHPRIELSLRSRPASWRLGAWLLLAGLAAGLYFGAKKFKN
jgi:hypothetical protein